MRAWATLAPDGSTRLILVNYDRAAPHAVSIKPPHVPGVANIERLTTPSASATSGVSLEGQSTGVLVASGASHPTYLVPAGSEYRFTLPAASAAVLTLIPGLSR